MSLRHCLAAALLVGGTQVMNAQQDEGIQDQFVRGVYWPWERTKIHADHAGMEFWEFVDHMMGRIAGAWHCNVIWFVNGPSEPDRVCDLAARHGLKVFCQSKLTGTWVHGLRGSEQLSRAVAATVEPLAEKEALGAYVIKDEPKCLDLAQMESFRRALHQADPSTPSLVVTMTGHTEPYALRSGFPVVCTDIYHFGGPRSPAIPNPGPRSQQTYRSCVEALVALSERGGKVPWSMPQAFADPWGGPYWIDERGLVVLESGAYWHWRMPSVAEMRWQTWESVRAGCRGVIFFAILLGGHEQWSPDQGEMPEALVQRAEANRKSWPTVTEQVRTDAPLCLTFAGGKSTPQADAMGEDFRRLEPLGDLLTALEPSRIPVLYADAPGKASSFSSTDPDLAESRWAVVVNDDLQQRRTITLWVPPNASTVTDIESERSIALSAGSVDQDGLQRCSLDLAPGDGAMLRLDFHDETPGFLLYDEAFSDRVITARLDNAERRYENRPFGMGRIPRVRPGDDPDAPSQIVLDDLQTHHHGRGSVLLTALRDVKAGRAQVFLHIEGNCPSPESLVVSFVDADGRSGWNKTADYHLPISVPASAESVRILLGPEGAVERVRFWRVDQPNATTR